MDPGIRNLHEGDLLRLDAGAIIDAHEANLHPASMLLRIRAASAGSQDEPGAIDSEILALDAPGRVDAHPLSSRAKQVDLGDSLLIPGLVNAHAHLDLTHVGPRPHDPGDGFIEWIDLVRTNRATDATTIQGSVRQGVALSLAGGTVAAGDIAGAVEGRSSLVAYRALRDSPLVGVSYLEFFAIGTRERASLDGVREVLGEGLRDAGAEDSVRLGLQPHAPYSASLGAYRWAQGQARDLGIAISTHLAETGEERQFVQHGTGPQREFLERLALWDDNLEELVGNGLDPVAHLAEILAMGPMSCAHVNDASDEAINTLARTRASVVYCPRASEYFAAERRLGAHRYREMLDAGVNVALGTDSIINLPGETRHPGVGISILDEMRLLRARDGVEARTLLAMATTNGAIALALDPSRFRFEVGARPAGIAVLSLSGRTENPWSSALDSSQRIGLLFHGNPSGLARMRASSSQE